MNRRVAAMVLLGVACNPKVTTRSEDAGARSDARAVRELPAPVALADVQVGEGSAHNLGFLLAFRVLRDAGDAGKTYQQAVELCRGQGRMLCTETQWLRACEEHAAVGRMESWTATRRGKNVVVAGGRNCGSRDKAQEGETHPHRVGLCCERAVALRTADAGPWQGLGTRFPLRFERALNEGNEKELRSMLSETVVRDGRKWTPDALLAQEREARPRVGWTLFDTCDMRTGPVVVDKADAGTGRMQGTLLTCRTLLDRKGDIIDYVTVLGVVGDGEDGARLAQIDHKGPAVIPGVR